ncbi:BA14K family protein [Nitrobacter sp.]
MYSDYGYYDDGPTAVQSSGRDVSYCRRRFKSYDVRSGTYLGRDGKRHRCP